jgi:hypothetical protein
MTDKKWKIISLIFIAITIMESAIMGYAYIVGSEYSNNRSKCIDYCTDKKSTGFLYDPATKRCACFNGNTVTENNPIETL